MTSILERLDDLIRGSLHRFVDRALESNSLIMYDQDVRDMEAAIDHLEEAATTMYAAAQANERRLARHQQDVQRLEQRVERLTSQGVEPTTERMMVAQAELAAKRELTVVTQAQIERQRAQHETLNRTLDETEVTAQTLKDARPRLESLLVLAQAYRSIEQVEMTLDALRGLGGDTDVATVADSIYQSFGEAQARLDLIRQAEEFESLAEIELAEVEDQITERRRRLGLESEQDIPGLPADTEAEAPPDPSPPPSPAPDQDPEAPEAPLDPLADPPVSTE